MGNGPAWSQLLVEGLNFNFCQVLLELGSKSQQNHGPGKKVEGLLSDFYLINTKSVITFESDHLGFS